MFTCKTTQAWGRALGWGLGLALFASSALASAAVSPQELEERYNESLRKATQENDITGATNEVDGALAEFRSEDPENPQLAALHLLRGVLLFAVDGSSAQEDILDSFKAALSVHPWAQFEPSMRSEPLDALLEQAREELREERGQTPPEQGLAFGRTDPRCGESIILYVAYSDSLGVSSATFHRRAPGASTFETQEMQLFAGVASLELSALEHQDQNADFFITLEGQGGQTLVSVGGPSSPESLDLDCPSAKGAPTQSDAASGGAGLAKKNKLQASTRFRRVGLRVSAGVGWGYSYGESERVYDIANPKEPGHYSLLATACAIARRAAPSGGGLPSPQQLFGSDAAAPSPDSIFGRLATNPTQAAQLAAVYDAKRCAQRHPIVGGPALSLFHVEPELSVRINPQWEVAVFSRLQLVHGLNILRPEPGSPIEAAIPQFKPLSLSMPWTIGLAGRYRKQVESVSGLSWFLGGFAGYGQAALAVPMPFGHDRNGNSVADENEMACSVDPSKAPVFPAMNGCEDPGASANEIEKLRAMANQGGKARDVLHLGKVFAGVEVGAEYMFTPLVGVAASGQLGFWFAGHRPTGLVDLKLGPSLKF